MNILAQSATVRRRAAVACGVLASLFLCGSAAAQFGPIIELPPGLPTVMPAPTGGYPPTVAPRAPGPYYAAPAWSQTLAPNVRFVILSNFNGDAVLDRETGLIWTRRDFGEWPFRSATCYAVSAGNHFGWRLPTVDELQSLIDASLPSSGQQLRLPVGHPFLLQSRTYWSSDSTTSLGNVVQRTVNLGLGSTGLVSIDGNVERAVLCVRGA